VFAELREAYLAELAAVAADTSSAGAARVR
jgi:hypothetical protein